MQAMIPVRRLHGIGDASSALIGGAISAGVNLATGAVNTWLNQIQLAHDADTATTQIVNQLAPLLQKNVDAYLAGSRTCADQAAALSAYLTAVNWLMSAKGCGNGAYGSAGNRCISDRFGGGGPTDQNAKWPWAAYYYWPIANDQTCAQDPNANQASAIQNIINTVTGNPVQTVAGTFASGNSTGSTASGSSTGSVTTTTTSGGSASTLIPGISNTTLLILGAALLAAVLIAE